ncbi:MAG: neutral zinc metallopeptidase [Calothrix sp. MO_167.B12]|nr:neutral zinc metallopeptidase [Calothrix sp. MO_167.B12]
MKIFKALTTVAIGVGTLLGTLPAHAREWTPRAVVDGVYSGIQKIHGYKATPRLIWGVPQGRRGACGPIRSSHYCTRNHTVYIPNRDIRMAYQHGDAALAYIIAHEYAHAMQTAYGFRPGVGYITELQADCLAGAYLGLIPNIVFDNKDIREIATFAHRIGDYAWGSIHHHGTPKQRVKAVIRGMNGSVNGKGISACRV